VDLYKIWHETSLYRTDGHGGLASAAQAHGATIERRKRDVWPSAVGARVER